VTRRDAAAPSKDWANVANHLSILRVLLAPAFVGCLLYYAPGREMLLSAALGVFVIACATDALDGFLARKLRQQTVFGSYIDPVADKFLLLSGFISLTFMGNLPPSMRIPAWVTIPVVTRDLVILIGATVVYLTTGSLKAEPLFVSKATTVSQMATLVAALVSAPPALQLFLFAATVTLTAVSGIQYIRIGEEMIQS
jgi:cardiolipin synthase